MLYNALTRIKKSIKSQSKQERKNHIKDAFCLKQDIKGKNILLIDDVMTTGSTLEEASITLQKGHPSTINCLCIARTILHQKQDFVFDDDF